jgi:hypothetical protein
MFYRETVFDPLDITRQHFVDLGFELVDEDFTVQMVHFVQKGTRQQHLALYDLLIATEVVIADFNPAWPLEVCR